jgi:predicted phosphohydrolase
MPFKKTLFAPPTTFEQLCARPLMFLTRALYLFFCQFNPEAPLPDAPIKVVCISDTHNHTHRVESGDILIHAGDLSETGTIEEIQAQIDWIDSLQFQVKIVVAGNHDKCLDVHAHGSGGAGRLDWKSIQYLDNEQFKCDVAVKDMKTQNLEKRRIAVFGSPLVPKCGGAGFGFQYQRNEDVWRNATFSEDILIDFDTRILITHTPPRYHCDSIEGTSRGCSSLLWEANRIRPTLHVCGHLHSARGRAVLQWDHATAAYQRACAQKVTGIQQMLSATAWRDLFIVLASGLYGFLRRRHEEEDRTTLVNAAMWYDSNKKPVVEPYVVYI